MDLFTITKQCNGTTLALIFIHPSLADDLWGWHYLSMELGQNHLLFNCEFVPQRPLQVSQSMDMYLVTFANNLQLSPEMAYQDYVKDCRARTYYNMSYTQYMENIVDMLIGQANCVEPSFSDVVKTDCSSFNDPVVTPPKVIIQMEQVASDAHPQEDTRASIDNNFP